MNVNVSESNMQGLAFKMALIGLVTTIFWMVVGWRAMRAHERIADAAERTARVSRENEN